MANYSSRSRDGRGTQIIKQSVVMLHQLHTYADLRKQIHHDLRIQHPEWVQPNGESPMCDSYETRLMETLDVLKRQGPSISYDCDRLR
jgi:hypothetical protein